MKRRVINSWVELKVLRKNNKTSPIGIEVLLDKKTIYFLFSFIFHQQHFTTQSVIKTLWNNIFPIAKIIMNIFIDRKLLTRTLLRNVRKLLLMFLLYPSFSRYIFSLYGFSFFQEWTWKDLLKLFEKRFNNFSNASKLNTRTSKWEWNAFNLSRMYSILI